jgi:phenylacetate-CoA ligase
MLHIEAGVRFFNPMGGRLCLSALCGVIQRGLTMSCEHLHTFSRIWKHPEKNQDELAAFRNRKLRSVLKNAYDNVRYYRDLFDTAGIKPEDIRTVNDLGLIPMTSSQDYRIRPLQETLSRKARPHRMVKRATSGSTGRPFIIRRSPLEDHLLNMFRIRAFRQFGVRVSDKMAQIRLVSASHHRENILGNIRQKVGIYRDYPLDCLQSISTIIRELRDLKPNVIKGYPAVISHIAPFISEEGKKDIRPRFLITGGESLVPFRRQLIERGFGKRVYDIYGSHEFNMLAWECPVTGEYHICDDNVIVEILRNGHPAEIGERGEVVVTGLHSYLMPFIRYRLGDVVTKGHDVCQCGQPFSTLKAIQGRMHDYFRMPDGSPMHPDEIVVPIMENESDWFDRYQLVQESENLIVLKVKPFSTPQEEQLQHVRNLAEERLPAGVEFRIDLVRALSSKGSGKFRFCKSKIHSDCENIDWNHL